MNDVIFPALMWRYVCADIFKSDALFDILRLMWHFSDPPDNWFDEKLLSLSIPSLQMKSFEEVVCVIHTKNEVCRLPHTHLLMDFQ